MPAGSSVRMAGRTRIAILLAIDLGLPAVVGVNNIDVLEEGQWVILDAERGVVVERLGMHVDMSCESRSQDLIRMDPLRGQE